MLDLIGSPKDGFLMTLFISYVCQVHSICKSTMSTIEKKTTQLLLCLFVSCKFMFCFSSIFMCITILKTVTSWHGLIMRMYCGEIRVYYFFWGKKKRTHLLPDGKLKRT